MALALRTTTQVSFIIFSLFWQSAFLCAQAQRIVDIRSLDPGRDELIRVYGSVGQGNLGVPVAGPGDVDGDGYADLGVGFMRASPLGRGGAGEVNLVFGKGHIGWSVDTSQNQASFLRIAGDVEREAAGNEIWIDDVTGDGIADLLVGRQNYSPGPAERIGAGALTLIVGGPEVRAFATQLEFLDLRNPPGELTLFTIVGRGLGDRMGMWMRTGDVDGDGIADILVAADQEDEDGESVSFNSGAVYVIRGGNHLNSSRQVELDDAVLQGHIRRITPPLGSQGYHTGATCLIADLDGNGRGEVLAAAALNRGGASIGPAGLPPGTSTARARGGSVNGTVYIAWDDNFPPEAWDGADLDFSNLPGTHSIIDGAVPNVIFGEELVGGLDFDGDQVNDLFVGDFGAAGFIGVGYVLYNAPAMKSQEFTLAALPKGIRLTSIQGTSPGAISSDTAAAGDFNGDGLGDVAVGSPHARPQGRNSAGAVHVLFGQPGGWPEFINTAPGQLPSPDVVRITEIQGARGGAGSDSGDTLCYSASAGDLDGDGLTDFITNEMTGNGLAENTEDVGNLVVVSGRLISSAAPPILLAQFGSGNVSSEILVNNPAATLEQFATARFYDDAGDPMPTPVSISGALETGIAGQGIPVDRVDFSIAPLGRVSIVTNGGEPLVGSAIINSNGTLGGLVRFQIPGIGIAGVQSSSLMSGFIVPVRSENGIDTGVAFMNPSEEEVDLELSLLDSIGDPTGGDDSMVSVPPRGHLAKFITELFEGVETPFVGSLLARVLNGRITAVAVELGSQPGEFTTLAVTPLEEGN